MIQNIRNQYDPLASKIPPHITLVFPFESEISSDILHQHLETSLYRFEPFNLSMQGISYEEGNYLFLNLIKGQNYITKIHDLLYSGILAKFLSRKYLYRPHLTVGRLKNSLETDTAKNQLEHFNHKFETEVNKITTEIILDDLSSEIDFEISLK